jgi:hypothetical protein
MFRTFALVCAGVLAISGVESYAQSQIEPSVRSRREVGLWRTAVPADLNNDGITDLNGISLDTAGPALAPSVWLKLSRRGDTIAASYKKGINDAWAPLGTQTYTGLPASLLAGMAVSSHVDGTTASATFTFVTVSPK